MKMKFRATLFLVAILPVFLFANEVRIVDGQETTKEEWENSFSGVVMLRIETPEGASSCTATIIDPQVLLTARHCIAYDYHDESFEVVEPSGIRVLSGLWCGISSATLAVGQKIVAHEYGDIALIHLSEKIAAHRVYPVRDDPQEEVGEKGIIVGYGLTGENKNDGGTQRWGEIEILSALPYYDSIEIGNSSGLCFGDSGGPMFTRQGGKDVVSGVASFMTVSCSSECGSHSVQVVKYRDWIEENMEKFTGHDLDKICGDGDLDEGETCEAGDEKDCSELGSYIAGMFARCNPSCDGYNLSECEDQICGNYRKEGSEACDDGNVENGDYCSDDCLEVIGKCGDGEVQTNEDCDDGNTVSGDGCDLVCKTECGDGTKGKTEECDDGNLEEGDGCDSECKLECGNGTLNVGEECDDGNREPSDGCDAKCVKEPSTDSGCALVILN
jgi:cysteine-rich repeat protein